MTSGSAVKKEQTGEFAKKVHLGGSKSHSAKSTDVLELSRTVVDDVPSRGPLCVSQVNFRYPPNLKGNYFQISGSMTG